MIKIEETEVNGFKAAIRGMRNPFNSHDKSDTLYIPFSHCDDENDLKIAKLCGGVAPIIGKNDLELMKKLSKAGTDHAKFLRFITVTADITAPLYWWKEYDTYKVGTVANSCSTMHKIADKRFEREDFSIEHIHNFEEGHWMITMDNVISSLNVARGKYIEISKQLENDMERNELIRLQKLKKQYWWQLIQLLPSSYNQKRTVLLNYQVLKNMYHARKNHKLNCWHDFCRWCESLPYFKEVCIDD